MIRTLFSKLAVMLRRRVPPSASSQSFWITDAEAERIDQGKNVIRVYEIAQIKYHDFSDPSDTRHYIVDYDEDGATREKRWSAWERNYYGNVWHDTRFLIPEHQKTIRRQLEISARRFTVPLPADFLKYNMERLLGEHFSLVAEYTLLCREYRDHRGRICKCCRHVRVYEKDENTHIRLYGEEIEHCE